MRRLLTVRRRLPGRLHPRGRRREHRRQPGFPGERYARIYEINMSRCIFCGYCELACPFDVKVSGTLRVPLDFGTRSVPDTYCPMSFSTLSKTAA